MAEEPEPLENLPPRPSLPQGETPESDAPVELPPASELTGELQSPFPPEGEVIAGTPARRPPLPLIGGFAAIAVIGVIFVLVAFGGGSGDATDASAQDRQFNAGLATEVPTPVATIDLTRAPASTDANLNLRSLDNGRLVIKKIGVDAPLTYKEVVPNPNGVTIPPNPNGPDDIAYYDFSAFPGLGGGPGKGGNAIYAGHVDSGKVPCKNGTVPPPCQAVFWDLKKLVPGDEIEVHVGGQVYRYRVTANQPVLASQTAWEKIYAATAKESMTLITCTGSFINGEYDQRLIVTAERVG